MDNSNKFLQTLKTILIIVLLVIAISIVFSIIAFVKDLTNKNKIDGDQVLKNTLDEIVVNGEIDKVTDEEKDLVNEEMSKPSAIKIDDIVSDLSVYEYKDIVVFVKNEKGSKTDSYSHNVVFRKTDKGLVFDGMFVLYGMFGYTYSNVSNFSGKADYSYYAKYNNYDFQKTIEWFAKGYTHSCFSFNDNVSKSIMLNSNIALTWWRPIKSLCSVFADYGEIYNNVQKYCLKDIIKSFTSFGENQHLMFDFKSMDSFSDFWTDVYKAISTLQKNCLVNYTNSSRVGLYSGVIGTDTCKYYTASSYFKVKYTYLGKKAYAVNSKDYSKNHEFNCENKVIAIPEINVIAEYDTTSVSSIKNLLQYLEKNVYKMKIKVDIKTNLDEDVKSLEMGLFDVISNGFLLYQNYFNLGEYKINITSYIDKNDGNGFVESNLITFTNGTFTIDNEISNVKVLFKISSIRDYYNGFNLCAPYRINEEGATFKVTCKIEKSFFDLLRSTFGGNDSGKEYVVRLIFYDSEFKPFSVIHVERFFNSNEDVHICGFNPSDSIFEKDVFYYRIQFTDAVYNEKPIYTDYYKVAYRKSTNKYTLNLSIELI